MAYRFRSPLSQLRTLVIAITMSIGSNVAQASKDPLFSTDSISTPRYKVLNHYEKEGVDVYELLFESIEGTDSGGEQQCSVYAILASPKYKKGARFPGMLLCHGATNRALKEKAIGWAKLGYVALSPEFGAYVNRGDAKSKARFTQMKSHRLYDVSPNPKASILYDSVMTGLIAYKLLEGWPGVDSMKIGLSGVSWGGFMAMKLATLLGDNVFAVYCLYGTGHFNKHTPGLGSQLKHFLPKLNERQIWLSAFDSADNLDKIKAPVFICAATNDQFFTPSGIEAAYDDINSNKYLCLAPNKSHWLDVPGGTKTWSGPTWTDMEPIFFERAQKGIGDIFPKMKTTQDLVAFTVDPMPEDTEAWFYITTDLNKPNSQRRWRKISASQGANGSFEPEKRPDILNYEWFGGISFPVNFEGNKRYVSLTTEINSTLPNKNEQK